MSAHPGTPRAPFPALRSRLAGATVADEAPPWRGEDYSADPAAIAARSAQGQIDRCRAPLARHLERVAAAVPERARRVALLHEALERGSTCVEELALAGLTAAEIEALRLLTRVPGDSYELHVLTIAHAPEPEGELARLVALADLDDHLARESRRPDRAMPPYRWARRHVEIGLARTPAALP